MFVVLPEQQGKYTLHSNGSITNTKTGFRYKTPTGSHGYPVFNPWYEGKHHGVVLLHRLVAEHFVPNPQTYRGLITLMVIKLMLIPQT